MYLLVLFPKAYILSPLFLSKHIILIILLFFVRLLAPLLGLYFEDSPHPDWIVEGLPVLGKEDVLEFQALIVEPGVGIVELDHVKTLLGSHEGRPQLSGHLLLGEQQFLHFHLALEVAQVVETHRDVVGFDVYLEVEERVFVVDLDDAVRRLAGLHLHVLFNPQHVERIHLALGVTHDGPTPETAQQVVDPLVLAPHHPLEVRVAQLAEDLEEEDELVSEGEAGSLSGLFEGAQKEIGGLLVVLPEEEVETAGAFEEFPHLVLLEWEGEKVAQDRPAEGTVVGVGPGEELKGLVEEKHVLSMPAVGTQRVHVQDDVVVDPRQDDLEQSQQFVGIDLAALDDLDDVERDVVEVDDQFLELLEAQLGGVGQEQGVEETALGVADSLLLLAHPQDEHTQHVEVGVVEQTALVHALPHVLDQQQQLREGPRQR